MSPVPSSTPPFSSFSLSFCTYTNLLGGRGVVSSSCFLCFLQYIQRKRVHSAPIHPQLLSPPDPREPPAGRDDPRRASGEPPYQPYRGIATKPIHPFTHTRTSVTLSQRRRVLFPPRHPVQHDCGGLSAVLRGGAQPGVIRRRRDRVFHRHRAERDRIHRDYPPRAGPRRRLDQPRPTPMALGRPRPPETQKRQAWRRDGRYRRHGRRRANPGGGSGRRGGMRLQDREEGCARARA